MPFEFIDHGLQFSLTNHQGELPFEWNRLPRCLYEGPCSYLEGDTDPHSRDAVKSFWGKGGFVNYAVLRNGLLLRFSPPRGKVHPPSTESHGRHSNA